MTGTLAALVVVVAAIYATAWLLRRLQGGAAAGGASLRTVAAAALGPRERVVVVEVGDTWLVLGVAPGSVRTLHTLPRGEVPAPAPAAPFAGVLAKLAPRRNEH